MRLPEHQLRRVVVVSVVYLVVVAVASAGLVLLRGPILRGLLAVMLAAALTVPLAVLGHRPDRR